MSKDNVEPEGGADCDDPTDFDALDEVIIEDDGVYVGEPHATQEGKHYVPLGDDVVLAATAERLRETFRRNLEAGYRAKKAARDEAFAIVNAYQMWRTVGRCVVAPRNLYTPMHIRLGSVFCEMNIPAKPDA